MFKISLKTSFFLLGSLWLFAGILLLTKGIRLLLEPHQSLFFSQIAKTETSLLLICLGLFLGQFKGKFVLQKNAKKRIHELSTRTSFKIFEIFNFKYFILIITMISLGLLLKYLHTPNDIRGVINVAIGTALAHSSFSYFKAMHQLNTI